MTTSTNARRSETQAAAIIDKLNREFHGEVLSCQAVVFGAPPVPGLGQCGGFQLQIEDTTGLGLQTLQGVTDTIVKKANAQPGLARVFTTFNANTPQLYLDIDREAAKQMGVTLADVNNTLNANMGSMYINQFNEFGRVWQVNIQAQEVPPQGRGELRCSSRCATVKGRRCLWPRFSGCAMPVVRSSSCVTTT